MNPSPFHGIFSALTDGARSLGATPSPSPMETEATPKSPGRVAVDIFEQDDYTIIKAPIAGVRLADLDIEVNENTITIRGHRRLAENISDDQYYLRECFWGEFERKVTLPFPVDPRKVKATFSRDCILKILIPKEERVKIVRIQEG